MIGGVKWCSTAVGFLRLLHLDDLLDEQPRAVPGTQRRADADGTTEGGMHVVVHSDGGREIGLVVYIEFSTSSTRASTFTRTGRVEVCSVAPSWRAASPRWSISPPRSPQCPFRPHRRYCRNEHERRRFAPSGSGSSTAAFPSPQCRRSFSRRTSHEFRWRPAR